MPDGPNEINHDEAEWDRVPRDYINSLWGYLKKRQSLEAKLSGSCEQALSYVEQIETLDNEHLQELLNLRPNLADPKIVADAENTLTDKGGHWHDFSELKLHLKTRVSVSRITTQKAFLEILRRTVSVKVIACLLKIQETSVRRELRRINKIRLETQNKEADLKEETDT